MNSSSSTPLSTILSDRDAGRFRVEILRRHGQSLEELLTHFRLLPNTELLFKLTHEQVTEALGHLLWKDLAYNTELIPLEVAKNRAKLFMEQLGNFATEIYSNTDELAPIAGTNLTATYPTFEVGFLFLSETMAVCLWVEEED